MSAERTTHMLTSAAEGITSAIRHEITESRPGAIEEARRWRANGGSLIAYFIRHSRMADNSLMTQRVINETLGVKDPDRFAWILSTKFMRDSGIPELGDLGIFTRVADEYADRRGFTPIFVVQQRYLKDLSEESRAKANAINDDAKVKVAEFMGRLGVVIGMGIEGSRYTDGFLHRADRGAAVFALQAPEHVRMLPIVLHGVHKVQPANARGFWRVNPLRKVGIEIGSMASVDDLRAIRAQYDWRDGLWETPRERQFTLADAMVVHTLSQTTLKPEFKHVDPRGVYIPENLVLAPGPMIGIRS